MIRDDLRIMTKTQLERVRNLYVEFTQTDADYENKHQAKIKSVSNDYFITKSGRKYYFRNHIVFDWLQRPLSPEDMMFIYNDIEDIVSDEEIVEL